MNAPLFEAMLSEVRAQPQTIDELSTRLGYPRAVLRSALATLCWDEQRLAPFDAKGHLAEATPADVMRLRSA